jgi:predicted PurR-regulated permease PerM
VKASRRGGLIQNIAFVVLVALTTIAFVWLLADFLMPVFWAAVLGIIFNPVKRQYLAAVGGRRALAAVLTILTILVLVVVPLFFLGLALSREAIALHQQVASGAIDLKAPIRFLERMAPVATGYLDRVGVDLDSIARQLSTAAVVTSQFIASRALAIGQNILRVAALFFLTLYVLFFFLRDGRQIVDGVVYALPLGDARERRLLEKFAEVSRATIKGTLVVGLVQGILGGVLFWLLGIPAPVFWGAVMTVLSILPVVGPGLVWAPAAIILFTLGDILRGIVLLAAGIFVIGLVDNVLRPILVGRDTKMPDYLVLLSTLGGLTMFGISGFVIGPIIAAFFLAVWAMFAEEYSQPPAVVAAEPGVAETRRPFAAEKAPADVGPEPRGAATIAGRADAAPGSEGARGRPASSEGEPVSR